MDTEKYIKLFNHGYFLAKHEPKVLEKLKKAIQKSPELFEPLKAGERQYMEERVQQRIQNISILRNKEKGKDKDKGREI